MHVTLEPLSGEHCIPQYVAWLNDPAVTQFLEARHGRHSMESVAAFVGDCIARDDVLAFAIVADGSFCGTLKLSCISLHHGTAELGLMIGEKAMWGHGVGRTAIALALLEARKVGVRKVSAGLYASNFGSLKAFLAAGWRIEGVLRDHFMDNGVSVDSIRLARFVE